MATRSLDRAAQGDGADLSYGRRTDSLSAPQEPHRLDTVCNGSLHGGSILRRGLRRFRAGRTTRLAARCRIHGLAWLMDQGTGGGVGLSFGAGCVPRRQAAESIVVGRGVDGGRWERTG